MSATPSGEKWKVKYPSFYVTWNPATWALDPAADLQLQQQYMYLNQTDPKLSIITWAGGYEKPA